MQRFIYLAFPSLNFELVWLYVVILRMPATNFPAKFHGGLEDSHVNVAQLQNSPLKKQPRYSKAAVILFSNDGNDCKGQLPLRMSPWPRTANIDTIEPCSAPGETIRGNAWRS